MIKLDRKTKERVNIKFLVKLNKTATKTFNLLCEVFEQHSSV